MNLFPQTVTRLRAPLIADGKGNQVRDWAGVLLSASFAGWIQPLSTDEANIGQERVVSRWRAFLEPDADVISTDRLQVDGATYQVDGEVQLWKDETDVPHHFEAVLVRVIGG